MTTDPSQPKVLESLPPWLPMFVAEVCQEQGIRPPVIVLRETNVFGLKPKVQVFDKDFLGPTKVVDLARPELRISPRALEEETIRLLNYRIALALIFFRDSGNLSSTPPTITATVVVCVSGIALFWLLRWPILIPIGVAVVSFGASIWYMTRRNSTLVRRARLESVKITGDVEAGIEVLERSEREGPKLPAFVQRVGRRMMQRDIDWLRRATSRIDDRT